MVKNSVKIYARLKQENQENTATYEICKTEKNAIITFRFGHLESFMNSKPYVHKLRNYFETKSSDHNLKNYRFEKIFDQNSTQTELFDTIAKPVVNSVIEGFNGTIFAYGQTGSGKTYAITGSSKDYQERGIIPRSIEDIFASINRAPDKYTIYISYLEIYNEVGYDLLNPKSQVSHLEELPKVILLEDGKGESHIRNLTVQRVSSEQEAMRLLFLGDNNRTTTETPMNEYSSRSHCIFTIFINSRSVTSGKIRRSKLNLVDLAGSERVFKSNISGPTLKEAKCINLSLYYLQQVILSLSHKKSHVPFRNSMLTYVLKDSLSGNCKTVLLATLNINKNNIQETIATCTFAQRVGEVNMEAKINTEIDPQQEVDCLKTEIESLRKQLLQQSKFKISGNLTKEEKQQWKKVVNNYLNDSEDEIPLKTFDMRLIKYSFELLKDAVKSRKEQKVMLKSETDNEELIEQYKNVIKQKEDEISTLKNLLGINAKSQPTCSNSFSYSADSTLNSSLEQEKENIPPDSDPFALSPNEKIAFEVFMADSKNTSELDYYTQAIQEMYEIARKLTAVVEICQNNILAVRLKHRPDFNHAMLEEELENQQSIYRNSLQKLYELKNNTEQLTSGLENAKMKLFGSFREWYNNLNSPDNTLEDNMSKTGGKHCSIDTLANRPHSANCKTRTCNTPKSEKKSFATREESTSEYNRFSISKLQNRGQQGHNSLCNNKLTKNCTEEEENDVLDDSKSEVSNRPKSPSRIPRLNKQQKNSSKESTEQLLIDVKNTLETSISRPRDLFNSAIFKNQKPKCDASSCDRCTNTDSKQEETENVIAVSCNAATNKSITPPNLEPTKHVDFCTKHYANPYQDSKIIEVSKKNCRGLLTTAFNSTDYKVTELAKVGDDNSCNISKECRLKEEKNQNSIIDFKNYLGRARSPYRQARCESPCKPKEKNNLLPAEIDNSFNNRTKIQLQYLFKNRQKTEHLQQNFSFKYNSRSPSPSTSRSNSCNNTVYQLIMGYDTSNNEQTSPRPWSACADSETKHFAENLRDYPKHRIGVSHVNDSRSPVRPSNKHCNSQHTNNYIENSTIFPYISKINSDNNTEKQETEESRWKNSAAIPKKAKTMNFHNNINIFGLRRSISPQKDSQIIQNSFNFATKPNQRQIDYRSPYTINNNYVNSPGNVPRISTAEDAKGCNKICNSSLFFAEDSLEFRKFVGTIPLTGDSDVDEEIVKFYRTKF